MRVFFRRKKQKNDGRKQIDLVPISNVLSLDSFSNEDQNPSPEQPMTIGWFQQTEELSMSIIATNAGHVRFNI